MINKQSLHNDNNNNNNTSFLSFEAFPAELMETFLIQYADIDTS